MSIYALVIAFAAFIIWLFIILWDNYEYYNWRLKIQAMKKKMKKFEIKLEWPSWLPRFPEE